MGERLLHWWEARRPGVQLLLVIPIAIAVIFSIHEAFFPLLSWNESLLYAVMEGVPLALIVVLITQAEIARRRDADGGPIDPPR